MRAIQIEQLGGPDVMHLAQLELGARPEPGAVRVRHAAIGVNFIDTYHRSGLYPLPLPAILGTEAAGTIEALGAGVDHLAVGDRVAYVTKQPGSYAEARDVPAATVVRIPDAIDFPRAAAMLLKGLTVQYLLRRSRIELRAGDRIVW